MKNLEVGIVPKKYGKGKRGGGRKQKGEGFIIDMIKNLAGKFLPGLISTGAQKLGEVAGQKLGDAVKNKYGDMAFPEIPANYPQPIRQAIQQAQIASDDYLNRRRTARAPTIQDGQGYRRKRITKKGKGLQQAGMGIFDAMRQNIKNDVANYQAEQAKGGIIDRIRADKGLPPLKFGKGLLRAGESRGSGLKGRGPKKTVGRPRKVGRPKKK